MDGTAANVLYLWPSHSGYGEVRRWDTDVFRSINGSEERAARLTDRPVYRVRATIKATTARNRQKLENLLRFGAKSLIYFPLWLSMTTITQDAPTTTAYCDSPADSEFIVGGMLIVIQRSTWNAEVRTIEAINADNIEVDTAFSAGFVTGDLVIPIIAVTTAPSNSVESVLDNKGVAQIVLNEVR